MKYYLVYIVFVNIFFNIVIRTSGQLVQLFDNDPDIFRNTTQILESRGFQSEIHHPVTQDGHILTLVRVINPYIADRSNLQPIYFQHGLFGNSDDFLLSRKGRLINGQYFEYPRLVATNCTGLQPQNVAMALPLVLSTCGYDVWLGNYRGNRYSNRHILLDPAKDPEYWAYSVDEYSLFDITANIQYILSNTHRAELGYIGHSLGTSGMFQLLSARPQYSKLIRPYVALAPVTHVFSIKALLLQVAAHNGPFIDILRRTNAPFFGMTSTQLETLDQFIGSFLCGNTFFRPLCSLFLFTLCGFDNPNLDSTLVPVAYGHFPDGTSTRVLAHLAQRVVKNTFSFFDYGSSKNLNLYGTTQAPIYNLSLIDNPNMIFISGINDYLADPNDVDILRSQLTVRPYADYVIPFPLFNHIDFLMGNNVGQYQNAPVLRWLREIYANR